ncbi:MAG: hypothetical protein B7Z37_19435 [Verrucomicrobia bacterium 12-59-8]|nr:MAG: hypothetical protein B7Z37_19435 [Verrucomicrobia bacterium 12-59-8]
MSSSPHPIFVLAVLGIVVSLIMLVTVFRVRRVGLKVLLVLIAVLALAPTGLVLVAMYPEWVDARFRSYKAFYEGIRPGMTRDEVMALQTQLYPEDGPRQKPQIIIEDDTSLTFFMHPEDSTEPNCEGIFLAFENGKLKSKTYSPD